MSQSILTPICPRLHLMAILAILCLTFGSCNQKPTSGAQENDVEVSDSVSNRDNEHQTKDTLENNAIIHKTKAQYVIY